MFTHLQVHSHYSLLEAIGAPKAYITQAQKLGMQRLAITDYAGLYGAIEFYQAAKKADIQAIIGVELGLVQDMSYKDPYEHSGRILLLAQNYDGYQNLLKLVSKGHLEGFHKIPRIDIQCLRDHATGLIALSGGSQSRLGKQILTGNQETKSKEQLQQLQSILGKNNCFLTWHVQETPGGNEDLINHTLKQRCNEMGIKQCASGNVHYIHESDQSTYETALAIKDGKRIYDSDRRLCQEKSHLQSPEELKERLAKTPLTTSEQEELLELTEAIAAHTDLKIAMDTILFPVYESDETIQLAFKTWKDRLITN